MLLPTTPINSLTSVGKTIASRLKKLNITTANDLLWHLPREYKNVSAIKSIVDLEPGDEATILVVIQNIKAIQTRYKRQRMTQAIVSDDTDSLEIIWFNQPFVATQFKHGDRVYISGTFTNNKKNQLYTANPTIEKFSHNPVHTARIIPIYPTTAGITQKQLRFLISQILPLAQTTPDYLPEALQKKQNLIPLHNALTYIHEPQTIDDYITGRKRLAFDELCISMLIVEKAKQDLKTVTAPVIPFQKNTIQQLVKKLPFSLTDDQRKVTWQVCLDLENNTPMNRLIQGDVGSGKTVVAALALANVACAGYQAIILAPTEVLATQHYHTLSQTIGDAVDIFFLTRTNARVFQNGIDTELKKSELLKKISSKHNVVIVGTHALLQEKITYTDIGLVIIDEQHRFGVKQRHTLHDATADILPHFASMTATPIPRSLSLTLYGDLELSRIKEKPKNRLPITTSIVTEKNITSTYDFIKKELTLGHQAFFVCPLIEESEKLDAAAATTLYKKLEKEFSGYTIALLHAKLKKNDKEKIIAHFRAKKINILVATSVIEVGVDIPDATVMFIESAERFGIAQLHQFRGRVGRSDKQSYCFLKTTSKNPHSLKRLEVLVKHHDGLAIAEADLTTRGPGDLYGYRQSGLPIFKIASLSDIPLIEQAKQTAKEIVAKTDQEHLSTLLQKITNSHAVHFE